MKNLSKYFSLRELTFSKIAEEHRIDNTPTPDALETLKYTASQLDKVRELLGKPVNISSGYRCLQVNRRLGSKDTSQHLKAEAVDFKCELFGSPKPDKLHHFCHYNKPARMSETDFWQKSGHFGRKIKNLTDKTDDKIYLSIFFRSSH